MKQDISNNVVRLFKDRRALLWVCQRHDLLPGEETHSYDLPPGDAKLRYRTAPTPVDHQLAAHYWRGIWIEGARSQILTAIRDAAKGTLSDSHRAAVVLAGSSDAHADVSEREFLPIAVLPGLLEDDVPPDSRFGSVRARTRERTAWDLAGRLSHFRGCLLVVIGARTKADLDFLYDVLADCPVIDLSLFVIWPSDLEAPPPPSRADIQFTVWRGSLEDFNAALSAIGAPSARDLPEWSIRLGNATITLTARDVHRILERFALITERDLIPRNRFELSDLHNFLEGSLENWAAYWAGLPVRRSYTSKKGLALEEEIADALAVLQRTDSDTRTITLQLPCEGGSGASTLLRSAAFQTAARGFPTIVLRPEQVNLDLEDLLAFTTAVSEASLAQGLEDVPPFVIILDVEHAPIAPLHQIAQFLSAQGRRAVIVQAFVQEDRDSDEPEQRSRRVVRLKPLLAETTGEEVSECEATFRNLAEKWKLPIFVPSVGEWRSYEASTKWRIPTGGDAIRSMFWVALRFFLADGAELTEMERLHDALGTWIERRTGKVADPQMKSLLVFVAALSSFRLPSPMWTVLRPITGGAFSSALVELFNQLKDIVVWGASSEELADYVLRFDHPALADEYLRRQGIRSLKEKVHTLAPVFASLSAGHAGDIWVIECFAAEILVPKFEERRQGPSRQEDWGWRLDVFAELPPLIRDQSKTILHHWARCLYQSAEATIQPALSPEERRQRIGLAIDKLKVAVNLPRRQGRDEHPSHLYNTLGVAYSKYGHLLKQLGSSRNDVERAWEEACKAFRQSIDLLPGTNLEALLAFADRLIDHSEDANMAGAAFSASIIEDLSSALGLLDEASDLLDDYPSAQADLEESILRDRARALNTLRSGSGTEYLRELQNSAQSDVGYYCEARLKLAERADEYGRAAALAVLKRAEERRLDLGPQSLVLQISLLQKQPESQFNFPLLRSLYDRLEHKRDYTPRPLDLFRHAVLCYQTGDYAEGAERFRRLREQLRRSGIVPPRVRDVWRAASDPAKARVTQAKVTRITHEWRAEGYIDELRQTVPLRPRHFSPPPKEKGVVSCVIRFEVNGPLAVPPRFEETSAGKGVGVRPR